MATMQEMIRTLYDRRRGVIEAQRETHAQMEADVDGEGRAELQTKWKRQDEEVVELGQRIDQLIAQAEHEKEMATQREKYEELVKAPDAIEQAEKNLDQRMRAWLRAGMEDSEVYQPPVFRFSLSDSGFGLQPGAELLERIGYREYHDLTKGSATAGGHTVPVGFVPKLYEHLIDTGAIRQTNVTVLTTDSGENLPIPKTTDHGAAAAIIAEGGTFTESDPAGTQVILNSYKYGKLLDVSTELIEDTKVDLLGYLARAAGFAIGLGTGAHYITGTGTGQPQGITAAGTVGKTGLVGQTLTVIGDDLVDLFHSVLPPYRRNGSWILNDLSAAVIRKLKDGTGGAGLGNYLWQPGLQAGFPDTIFGRPVYTDPNMPVMAANALSIAFGDFSLYYVIRDVDSVQFKRSDDFRFDSDLVSFRVRFRTDGKQLINGTNAAVKFYKNSAT